MKGVMDMKGIPRWRETMMLSGIKRVVAVGLVVAVAGCASPANEEAAPAASAPAPAAAPAPTPAPAPATTTVDLPPIQRQPTVQVVIDEHLDAINKCDWNRLMAQYPDNVEFYLPGGQVVVGRLAVGDLFRNFVKPVKDGGLCGMNFVTERAFTVDGTINVQWVANADFLAEPYRGADAYVTKDGLMWAQVTTFRGDEIKMK
jgi:hypothetical protein